MRLAVTNVQVPFLHGGAETLASGLVGALRNAGLEAELVTLPFRFQPAGEVLRSMDAWEAERFDRLDCGPIDAVICLRFPTYYLRHPNRIVWLLHQHRAVYELFGTPHGAAANDPEAVRLREETVTRDEKHLATARAVYTIGSRVSERLLANNGIASSPIHHPPAGWTRFRCGEQLPYVFFPSRLEDLKRQELLIRAMRLVRSSVAAILAGEGGARPRLEALIKELDLGDRVRLIGHVDFDEMLAWYANALAVFFGPLDEDYGYVTLEAMLSSKPVITCTDSGGPTEFVLDAETGLVTEPSPVAVADAIDRLAADRVRAKALGQNGRERYLSMDIRWENVVDKLVESAG